MLLKITNCLSDIVYIRLIEVQILFKVPNLNLEKIFKKLYMYNLYCIICNLSITVVY